MSKKVNFYLQLLFPGWYVCDYFYNLHSTYITKNFTFKGIFNKKEKFMRDLGIWGFEGGKGSSKKCLEYSISYKELRVVSSVTSRYITSWKFNWQEDKTGQTESFWRILLSTPSCLLSDEISRMWLSLIDSQVNEKVRILCWLVMVPDHLFGQWRFRPLAYHPLPIILWIYYLFDTLNYEL